MKLKLNLYRSLLILSFLIVNALLIYGIASTWSFLNTGADKATLLHITAEIESAYQPKVNWNLMGQKGRIMEKQTLKDLEKDYKSAWYVKYNALGSNNPFGLADYYTDDAQVFLIDLLNHNRANGSYIRGTSINHNPKLLFYSLDGKLVVFNDENVETFEEIYIDEKLIHTQTSTNSYQVTMLLEDGFWRIRQMVKIKQPKNLKKQSAKPSSGVDQAKGVNYYPKKHPWDMFGKNFNDSTLHKDFGIVKEMGLNSVRIFIPYEAFGGATVKDNYLKQVRTVLDIAEEHKIKILITLFDFYSNYDVLDWTLTHRHAETIVDSVKDHNALLGWDLKNEPDLDFEARGKGQVIAWLSSLAKQIKSWDSEHPITIGWSTPEAATELWDQVDFVSFHYYENPDELPERYLKLKNDINNKPIVLQEYGYSSYSGIWNGFSGSENKQVNYLEEIQEFIAQEELSFYIWTLYDFEKIPNSVAGRLPWRKTKQKHFGLLDENGQSKKVYKHIVENKKGDN